MKVVVYQIEEKAVNQGMSWERAIFTDCIEVVEVIDITVEEEENIDDFMSDNYPTYCDSDNYFYAISY